VADLERMVGYVFHNKGLLLKALTHSSYAHENPRARLRHNERVEFLGDAVLDLLLAEYLFRHFTERWEGELSLMRSWLASESSLADVAQSINLGGFLFLGVGEETSGGRHRAALLADGLEAVLGAIYLDADLETTRRVVLRLFADKLASVDEEKERVNYKNALQSRMSALGRGALDYRVLSTEGPEHMKRFEVMVCSKGAELGRGTGSTKKEAEMQAACAALLALDAPT
jgi:ribonuclease-3